MKGLDQLKSRVIFKFPFLNPLFLENERMLEWPFSECILVTAYDLLKNDPLISKLQRQGSTLKEYFVERGFNKNIKIMADTGIFAFEFRKAKLDLSIPIEIPDKLENKDIFMAYELIDPDYLVAPDEIILWEDSLEVSNKKIQTMEGNLNETLDRFDRSKIYAVLQGIETVQINYFCDMFKSLKIERVARGGLLPLIKNKAVFSRLLRESELLARNAGIKELHGFGLPGVNSLPEYFVNNTYDTIDTSTIYFYTLDKRYLDEGGRLIPVKNAFFNNCGCEYCANLLQMRGYPNSGNFMINLYSHNSLMVIKLLGRILNDPDYLKKHRGRYYRRKIIERDTVENYSEIITTAGAIDSKNKELMGNSKVHKNRLDFLKLKKARFENIRIAVISSCSKSKKYFIKGQPDCNSLDSQEKRESVRGKYSDVLLPARELYMGYQHRSIQRALRELRKRYTVDHYIVSAGFGLVHEDYYLPPYDCTFSDRSPREVDKMRLNLGLLDSLAKMNTIYDLVYLALGKDYLEAFGCLKNFGKLGGEIIYFSDKREVKGRLVGFTQDEFSQLETDGKTFYPNLDFTLTIKGNLLHNFAKSRLTSFVEYWHTLVECNCDCKK